MTNAGAPPAHHFINIAKRYIHWILVIGHLSFSMLGIAVAQSAFDPLALAVGARALGMGGACTAVADEGGALFHNPAALGEIDKVKLTSTSATLLEEVQCTVLGGVLPFGDRFAVGLGYAGGSVSGLETRDNNGVLLSRGLYTNGALVLSVGQKLSDRSSLGLNLKYYFSDGSETSSGNGRGWNLDLGILQSGWNWLKLGIVGQNLLNTSRINYANGASEPLPLAVRTGIRVYLTGSGYDSAFVSPLETSLVADADSYPQGARPTAYHAGVEVSPLPAFTLRTGFNGSNATAGISFRYAGLGFHYAYHPYGDFSGSTVNYFSLSYDESGFPLEPEVPDTSLALSPAP